MNTKFYTTQNTKFLQNDGQTEHKILWNDGQTEHKILSEHKTQMCSKFCVLCCVQNFVFCLSGDLFRALLVFEQLRDDGKLVPDEIIYNSLLESSTSKPTSKNVKGNNTGK